MLAGSSDGDLRVVHSSVDLPFLLALNVRTGVLSAWIIEPRKTHSRESDLQQTPRYMRGTVC
jgi:hypothetical protein